MNPLDILVRVLGGDAAAAKLAGVTNAMNGIVGKAAALVGSLASVAAVTHAINTADEMGKFAQKVGVAVDQLSRFTYAARASNVESGELRTGLRSLADWMVKTGQEGKSVTEVLLEQADAFTALPDGAQKSALAMDRFGRSGEAFIPFLNQGREGIQKLIDESDRLGATISGRFAADAAEFNDTIGRIGRSFGSVASQIAERALPELTRLAKGFESFVQTPGVKQFVSGTGDFLARAIGNTIPMFRAFTVAQFEAGKAFSEGLLGGKGISGSVKAAIDAAEVEWEKLRARMAETELGLMGRNPDGSERDSAGGKPGSSSQIDLRTEALRKRIDAAALALRAEQELRLFVVSGGSVSTDDGSSVASPGAMFTRAQRVAMVTKTYKEQLDVLGEIQKLLVDQQNQLGTTEEQKLQIEQEKLEVMRQQYEISERLISLERENSFSGRLLANIQEISDKWSNFGANAADLLTNTLNTGVEAFAQHIGNAVMGAESLAEAFSNIGRTIVQEVVTGIIRMFAQMIISRLLYSAIDKAASTGEAAAKAPGAFFTSVSSYGTAAVVGSIALLAGLAAIGAFEQGGIVRGGRQLIQVNEAGEEAVINARGLNNIGAGLVEAINAGLVTAADFRPGASAARGGGVGGAAIQNDNRLNILFLQSEDQLAEQLRRTSARSVILDVTRRSAHHIPGRSA